MEKPLEFKWTENEKPNTQYWVYQDVYCPIVPEGKWYHETELKVLREAVKEMVEAAKNAPIKRLDESELVFIGRYKFFYIKLKQSIAAVETVLNEKND